MKRRPCGLPSKKQQDSQLPKFFGQAFQSLLQVGTETHAPFTQWETGYENSVEAPTPVQANQCLCSRRGWERDFSRDFESLSHPQPLLSQRLAVVLSRGLWISFFCTASGYLACPEGAQGISSRTRVPVLSSSHCPGDQLFVLACMCYILVPLV